MLSAEAWRIEIRGLELPKTQISALDAMHTHSESKSDAPTFSDLFRAVVVAAPRPSTLDPVFGMPSRYAEVPYGSHVIST